MTRQKGKGPQRRPPARPAARPVVSAPPRPRFTEEQMRRRRRIAVLGIVLFGTTGILAANRSNDSDKKRRETVTKAAEGSGCTLDQPSAGGRDHVAAPTYTDDPPAGGDHTPNAVSDGVYEPGSVPTDGELVHAQEHGFVVLWYQPDAPAADIDGLKAIYDANATATIVVPRESMDVPVAATAWKHRLLCAKGVDGDAIAKFVEVYRDRGPEKGFVEG